MKKFYWKRAKKGQVAYYYPVFDKRQYNAPTNRKNGNSLPKNITDLHYIASGIKIIIVDQFYVLPVKCILKFIFPHSKTWEFVDFFHMINSKISSAQVTIV